MKISKYAALTAATGATACLAMAGLAAPLQAQAADRPYFDVAINGPIEVLPAYPDPNHPDADPDLSLVTFNAEVCVNDIPQADIDQGYDKGASVWVDEFVIFDEHGDKILPEIPEGPDAFAEKSEVPVGECASGTINFIVDLSETETNWISWKDRASNEDKAFEIEN